MIRNLLRSIGRHLWNRLVPARGSDLASHRLKEGLELRSPGQDANTSITVKGDFGSCTEARFLFRALNAALEPDLKDHAPGFENVLGIPGMSGQKYRHLINRLVSMYAAPRYLEVGSWAGSTACAAIHGNRIVATCIDNWSEFGGPRDQFFANIKAHSGPQTVFSFIEGDFRKVDFGAIGPFNIYLFDGPHAQQDQYDGVRLARRALADTFVLIVDDWNWEAVRTGTYYGITDEKLRIFLSVEIRTSRDNSYPSNNMQNSDWHNGYFLCVCRKPTA